MKREPENETSLTESPRALAELMRDENAWVGQEWNSAWEKLKRDLYARKLVRS